MSHDDACQRFLDRLEGVRETAPDDYIARCPAHDDKKPSLSIKREDGKFLVHCHSQHCPAIEIMGSVGLRLRDMFDQPITTSPPLSEYKRKRNYQYKQAFDALEFEINVLIAASNQLRQGVALSDKDHERLQVSIDRLMGAKELCK